MNIIPEIGHFKVACDTVSVVSNCIMGLFWGRYPFFSDCDVVWETGTKFVAQNISIVQFESHGQSQGRSLKKKFIYQIKTSLRPSCDRCDPVCDTWLRNQFFKGWFSHDRYDSSVCWTISSYLGEHMDTRRTLRHHFLARLIYRESKNPNQLKFPTSRL